MKSFQKLLGDIEKVVQGFGKDASMNLNKLFDKLQDFKIPKK